MLWLMLRRVFTSSTIKGEGGVHLQWWTPSTSCQLGRFLLCSQFRNLLFKIIFVKYLLYVKWFVFTNINIRDIHIQVYHYTYTLVRLIYNIPNITNTQITIRRNDNISTPFMAYQFLLFVSGILGPATVLLMIGGSFNSVLGTNLWQSHMIALCPTAFYILVCFTTKCDTQVSFILLVVITNIF